MKKFLSLTLSVLMLLSITAGINLTAFAAIEIDNVEIYNVTEPVPGANPDFSYQQYDFMTDHVDKNVKTKSPVKNGIAWFDIEANKYLTEKSVFKCSQQYRVDLYIKAASNAFFSHNGVQCTINNNAAMSVLDEEEAEGEGLICSTVFTVTGDHKWKADENFDRATLGKDGKKTYTCKNCGATKSSKITKISSISLSPSSYTYDGKVKSPKVVVKNAAGTYLKEDGNFMYGYDEGRKNVGTYSVEIILKGNYYGIFAREFKINPKGTTLSKVTSPKKQQIKVTWKKQSTQTTGYQVQFATNSKFTNNKKLYTVKGTKTTSKTISSLKAGKKYYVRVRTYKDKDGEKYYSAWSSYKTITVKK